MKNKTRQKGKMSMRQLKGILKESGVPFEDDNMVQEADQEFKEDFKDVQIGDVGETYSRTEKWKVIRKGTVRDLAKYSPLTNTEMLDPNQPAVLCKSLDADDWAEKPIIWVYGEDGFMAFKKQSKDRWFEEGMEEEQGVVEDPESKVLNEESQNDTLPAEKVNEVYKLLIESQNKLEEAARMLCDLHGVGAQIWRDLTKMDGMYEEPMSNLYRITGE